MTEPRDESPLITEFDVWRRLTTYEEWDVFASICADHIEFLQKEVNRCVREKNLIDAYGFLMQLENTRRLMGRVTDRMIDLKKDIKAGG